MARTWAEIEKLGLTDAEKRLVECCKAGTECRLGDERPEGPSDERNIRAEVLRYLILGGCEDCRVHEWGVQLVGAWVSGTLDLSFATARGAIGLLDCTFENSLTGVHACIEVFGLNGSFVPGLSFQGAKVAGSVSFSDCFTAKGTVSLSGSVIGGQLNCSKGFFESPGGDALNAEGARVSGSAFLSEGFRANGIVTLSGAMIDGQLACVKGQFYNPGGKALNAQDARIKGGVFLRDGFTATGEVRLSGARIGGQLDCLKGRFENPIGSALNAQRTRITEGFVFRKVNIVSGIVNLASAHVGDLVDDLDSWPESGRNYLNGFTYDKIGGKFTAVNFRLDWLSRGTVWNGEFHPQPYTHLAKVYRSMGHDAAARVVSIKRMQLTQWHDWQRAHRALNGDWGPAWRSVVADWVHAFGVLSRIVVGYGYAPFRSLGWLIGLALIAITLAHLAWTEGSMVPNSPVILTSTNWQAYETRSHAGAEWSASTAPGQDWETFNPLAWGADLVIPILDLGQTQAWAPSTARGGWGYFLWWAQWFLEAFGWIVAGLFAAAITGIIRKDDD